MGRGSMTEERIKRLVVSWERARGDEMRRAAEGERQGLGWGKFILNARPALY